jgi:hypothetical protein
LKENQSGKACFPPCARLRIPRWSTPCSSRTRVFQARVMPTKLHDCLHLRSPYAVCVFRALVALVAAFDLDTEQLDNINAFLNSPMDQEGSLRCAPERLQNPLGMSGTVSRMLTGSKPDFAQPMSLRKYIRATAGTTIALLMSSHVEPKFEFGLFVVVSGLPNNPTLDDLTNGTHMILNSTD